MGLRIAQYYIFIIVLTKGVISDEIRLDQSPAVVKRPGESVKISCKITGFRMTSHYMHWIRQKPGKALEWIGRMNAGSNEATYADSVKNQFTLTEDVPASAQFLEAKSLRTEDTAVYYCARGDNYYFDYWGKGTSVTVTSAVQGPPKSLFPLWQCGSSSEGLVTLGCVTQGLASADGLTFSWMDESGNALTDIMQYPAVLGDGGYTSVSQARVKADDWNGSKQFKCQVKNSLGVLYKDLRKPEAQSVKPSISISSWTTHSTVDLFCWLDGFYPKEIEVKWYEDNTLLGEKITTKTFEISNGEKKAFSALSQLSINAKKWNKGTEFKCEAKHQSEPVSQTWSKCKATPPSKPLIRLEKPRLAWAGSNVTASCVVESVFDAKVSWNENGQPITGEVSNTRQEMTTVNNLTISTSTWNDLKTITCEAQHLCFGTETKTLNIIESSPKTPTVEIRRVLADALQEDSAVLECAARDLPTGELLVTFHANNNKFREPQYVDLPKSLESLAVRFTVPKEHQAKDQRFSCQIQQSQSILWKSNSTGNIFDAPSVELSVVPSANEPGSTTQKLLCSATGFYPKVTWPTKSANQQSVERAMKADGRVTVSSEIAVLQQEWNKGDTITCRVSDQASSVEKNISFCAVTPAQEVHIYLLAPSISEMRANELSVSCLLVGYKLNNFSITWRVGNVPSSPNKATQTSTDNKNGTQSVRSVLKVPAMEWNSYTTVSCEVKHFCAKTPQERTISKTRDLKSPIVRILRPSDDDLSGIHNSTLLCLIEGFRPADISVHWELNGKRLDVSRFTNSPVGNRFESGDYSMHSALTLPAFERENGTFACVVIHESLKNPISTTINNIYASVTEHAPSVKLLQGQDELVCLVYGYSPSAINITWLLNRVTVEMENSISSSAKGLDGKFSIQSRIKLQAVDWVPGDAYTCLVEHITGTAAQDISKPELGDERIYCDQNNSEDVALDQAEENWNMACAFIVLFIISLLYGCSVTLVKVKTA